MLVAYADMLVGGFPGTKQNNETNSDVTDNYQLGVNYDMINWLLHSAT